MSNCMHCGADIQQCRMGRPRKFCSARCTLRHSRGISLREARFACRRCNKIVSFVSVGQRGRVRSAFCSRRCSHIWDVQRYKRLHRVSKPAVRERMLRTQGTFLNEDLLQEIELARLEGRDFNRREFYRTHSPYRERGKLPSYAS